MNILIRADANTQIGSGHLMRCLALAQGLKRAGHETVFLTATEDSGLLKRLENEGFGIYLLDKALELREDARQTKRMTEHFGCNWVVTDGYNFTEEYQRLVMDFPRRILEPLQGQIRLLCIDDIAKTHFVADIVLNQNTSVSKDVYSCESHTKLLLGPKYALIRQEFLRAKAGFTRRFPQKANNILVTFGGEDSRNMTLKVLRAIDTLDDPEMAIKVVVGELNPHIEALRSFITKSQLNFEILTNVGSEMPELMKWADLTITVVGSTLWELCLLKVPTIAGIVTDNQKNVASALSDIGAVRNVGWLVERSVEELADDIDHCIQDSALRKSMSDSMAQVVDGKGVERVVSFMEG